MRDSSRVSEKCISSVTFSALIDSGVGQTIWGVTLETLESCCIPVIASGTNCANRNIWVGYVSTISSTTVRNCHVNTLSNKNVGISITWDSDSSKSIITDFTVVIILGLFTVLKKVPGIAIIVISRENIVSSTSSALDNLNSSHTHSNSSSVRSTNLVRSSSDAVRIGL